MKVLSGCLPFFLAAPGAVFGQPPAAEKLTFEVASVRALPPHTVPSMRGIEISGDRVHIGPMILENLIALAYGVQNHQLQGPAWLTSPSEITLFDVDAKLPGGTPRTAVPEMIQNLLAERFLLSVEIGSTDVDAFALTVAKDGPRFRRMEARGGVPEPAKDYKGMPLTQLGGVKFANGPDGTQHIESSNIPGLIFYFTNRYYPRTFLDETRLTGEYDIKLDIPPPDLTDIQRGNTGDSGQRSLDALSAGLAKEGLRLERRKTPMKAIIVKHIEKVPTPN